MFSWNDTFKSESTQYFTILPLRKFAKEHKNKYLKTNAGRLELLSAIEKFANESEANEEIVLDWIDTSMKEGRREVYIQRYDDNPFIFSNLISDKYVEEKLTPEILNITNQHIIGNTYTEDFKLIKFEIQNNSLGRVISLYMCKMIYCSENSETKTAAQIYPAVVDVLVNQGCLVSRVKTKSNMYKYRQDTHDITILERTTIEKQAISLLKKCCTYLQINIGEANTDIFKTRLFNLLDDCTHTPEEIVNLMKEKTNDIEQISKIIIEDICMLDDSFMRDVEWDLSNMVEKYLSMTYPDQRIFTKNRIAYPIKLDATDQQASRVQQTAGFAQPLQSKDIFFDNKKMLQKNRKCESVKFSYERNDPVYCHNRYDVQITVKPRLCIVKFFEYTVEEDIENVLCSIMGNDE